MNAQGNCRWAALTIAPISMMLAAAIAAPAQTFKTLHNFDNTDGAYPTAGLVQATDGNLYGTTNGGGAYGSGTVFKMTPSGTLTTLYSFCSQSGCPDGSVPNGLVQGLDGNLYGTTSRGGASACLGDGCGTVFRITLSGSLTTLHSFCSQGGCTDGYFPLSPVVQGSDGNFYGTASSGGANAQGTVFRITPSGTLTPLHSFCSGSGCPDGQNPYAGLVQATDGNFYGTTAHGGANGSNGTIFRITGSGTLTTLYSLCSRAGCTNGSWPDAGLVQATDGNLYGTTYWGGVYGHGTVFRIALNGSLTTLYSFCPQYACRDGENPFAGLVQATDGNLYGATYGGGAGYGTVFKITPSGTLTTLHRFDNTDGANAYAGLVQDTNGNFYGTTYVGGANGYGTVFSLAAGLGAFVETQPTSGKVGAGVKILGADLAGATSVTFNGAAATFKVVSTSFITTTVPAGATTGPVQVVTPKGTLTSNVNFQVLP